MENTQNKKTKKNFNFQVFIDCNKIVLNVKYKTNKTFTIISIEIWKYAVQKLCFLLVLNYSVHYNTLNFTAIYFFNDKLYKYF